MFRVAYFVSPHGFGHAARACAVMEAMTLLCPEMHFDIYTEVPRWFFAESLSRKFSYRCFPSDVGLVQISPLSEDLQATVVRLADARENEAETIRKLAGQLRTRRCSLVIADISPLGLAAAKAATLPSALVANFTWDWVYNSYPGAPPQLVEHGRRLSEVFLLADLKIRAEPFCDAREGWIDVPPVARMPRTQPAKVREILGVSTDDPMIVVSMGGVSWDAHGFSKTGFDDGPWIVVPGGSTTGIHRRGRLLLLPFHAQIYHPDLVGAADLVVSKLGYSTVAEAYCTRSGMLYLERSRFPESPVLARWVEEHMVAEKITEEELLSGIWLTGARRVLEDTPREPSNRSGAALAAEAILERFGPESLSNRE